MRDLLFQQVFLVRRRRLAAIAAIGFALGSWIASWQVAAGVACVGVLVQILHWWIRIALSLQDGLGVGQSVTAAYSENGDLALTDVTGRVERATGSTREFIRHRSTVSVFGPELAFVLPAELVTEEDVEFLRRRDEQARAEAARGALPLSQQITSEIQDELVSSYQGALVGSADFLVPVLATSLLLLLAAATAWSVLFTGLAAVSSIGVISAVRNLSRIRRAVALLYPLGTTIRADVTAERLIVSTSRGTSELPWTLYRARRLAGQAVLLQRHRRPLSPDRITSLPRGLFTPAAINQLERALPRRF